MSNTHNQTIKKHTNNTGLLADVSRYRQELLNLLKDWHYYNTEVLQRILFAYENIFGTLEQEIEQKDRTAKTLERKYQMLSYRINRGEKITRKSLEFIDRLLEIDTQREVTHPRHRSMHRGNVMPLRQRNGLLDTRYNDGIDIAYLYRQIVKRLHPDIVGESTAFRACWDNVQNCYRQHDIDRLKMFYAILCHEHLNNVEEVQANEVQLKKEVDDLKAYISQQHKDIDRLLKEEPFSIEEKLDDQSWIIERKNLLRDRLVQANKRILHHNKLLQEVRIDR
ncbi:MAG: hypothetical protein LBO69_06335 [Ignavibacteria bacterium]|jgi:hypothetical protein|nr:hypothetical protein [Ignavibacteria bacterium]